jgi:hypothetical protein
MPWGLGSRLATRSASSELPVTGTVRSAAGKALTGICVEASARTAHFAVVAEARTGRGGTYRVDLFAGPRWTIEFLAGCDNRGNFAPQWWKRSATIKGATPVRLRKGEHLAGINASLGVGATITGTVRSAGSAPHGVAGVCVIAAGTGPMSGFNSVALTGRTGAYRLPDLGTGTYRVAFVPKCFGGTPNYLPSAHHGLVHVTDGKTVTGINGIVTPAARISGTVTTGGTTQVAGICVTATSSAGAASIATTGSHGGYSIGGLPAGHYTVGFSGGCGNTGSFAPQYYNGQAIQAAADLVTAVAGQTTSGIDANMQPGGTVTGTVTNHSGAKLSGICVMVASPGDVGGLGPSPIGALLAGLPLFSEIGVTTNGSYQVANLAPGSYQVGFSSGCSPSKGPAYAPQWFTPQGGNSPTWLSVGAGNMTTGIGAKLRAAGAITGVVKNANGQGLRSICPVALGLTGQPSTAFLQDLTGIRTRTDATGAYRITGLATGKYAVGFGPCDGQPYARGWYANAGSAGSARPVTVRDGMTTAGVNQVMTGGGTLAGSVTASGSGSPVRNECAEAVDSGGAPAGLAFTTSTGGYRIGHLAAGTYHLVFFACRRAQPGLADVTRKGVRVTNGKLTKASVALPMAGSVAGTVLAGNPAVAQPGICVEATPKTGSGVAGLAVTGPGGSYRMPGLAAGSYQVVFTPNCLVGAGAFVPQALTSPVSVTAGTTTSGVGATLAADGGISGTVKVSTVATAGVCVIAYPSAAGQAPSVAVTGADGSYQLTGLLPDSYKVEFTAGCGSSSYATQWYNGSSSRTGATSVPVSAGTVTGSIDAN